MKTTIDLPDGVFRKAKARAAERGISLKRFITEAVETRLANPPTDADPKTKPWMQILEEVPRVASEALDTVNRRMAEADAADLRIQAQS